MPRALRLSIMAKTAIRRVVSGKTPTFSTRRATLPAILTAPRHSTLDNARRKNSSMRPKRRRAACRSTRLLSLDCRTVAQKRWVRFCPALPCDSLPVTLHFRPVSLPSPASSRGIEESPRIPVWRYGGTSPQARIYVLPRRAARPLLPSPDSGLVARFRLLLSGSASASRSPSRARKRCAHWNSPACALDCSAFHALRSSYPAFRPLDFPALRTFLRHATKRRKTAACGAFSAACAHDTQPL